MTLPHPSPTGGPLRVSERHVANWGLCLATHGPWLRTVILARTGEMQAVEEVLQQVALAAVEQKSPLSDPTKVAPWLHRIAVVQSARYRRKRGRDRRAMRQVAENVQQPNSLTKDPLSWLLLKERHEQTRIAVGQLPGADAEILLLKYGEGWSYRRIAERLGITEKAVEARLTRARARLRHALMNMGISEFES